MNKEEVEYNQSEEEEEETFTKKEIRDTIIEDMKDISDKLFYQYGDFLCLVSTAFAISFVTLLAVTKISYNKWR